MAGGGWRGNDDQKERRGVFSVVGTVVLISAAILRNGENCNGESWVWASGFGAKGVHSLRCLWQHGLGGVARFEDSGSTQVP